MLLDVGGGGECGGGGGGGGGERGVWGGGGGGGGGGGRGGGVSECSERRNLFLMKENWICVMARHLSQIFTGKPPFDPDVRP